MAEVFIIGALMNLSSRPRRHRRGGGEVGIEGGIPSLCPTTPPPVTACSPPVPRLFPACSRKAVHLCYGY